MRLATQIWVHPSFKKKLKRMAIETDTNVLELTEVLARKNDKKKIIPEFEFNF